ncbi:MAG: hypothetical protein WBL50_08795 [Candidatus Acidiferrum sp.]
MNHKPGSLLSRRQFARRAAVVSATAALAPAEALLPQAPTQLSPEGQLEADSRYQQILALYGNRLDDTQKAAIKKACADLQPSLEKIRKFNLQNGNAPALYLKPLVERDKKPQTAAAPRKS